MTSDLDAQLRHLADATDPAPDPIAADDVLERAVVSPLRPRHSNTIFLKAVAAILVVVGLAGTVLVVRARVGDDRPDSGRRPPSAPPATTVPSDDANVDLLGPGEHRALPPAPIAAREGAAAVWTGSVVFLWGGNDEGWPGGNFADGATYDPRANTWEKLPPAPLSARSDAVAVWTGNEVLVWGGFTSKGAPEGSRPEHADGAAYNPATRTWRPIADAPITGFTGALGVWTGTDVVVVTGQARAAGGTAAAYDPATDRWRRLPDPPGAPSGTSAASTSSSLITIAVGEPDTGSNWSLDPSGTTWTEVSGAQLAPIAAANHGVIGLTEAGLTYYQPPGRPDFARFGPILLPEQALDGSRSASRHVFWTGRRMVVWGSGSVAAIDPMVGVWTVTGRVRTDDSAQGASVVWADGVLFSWGGFPASGDGELVRPVASPPRPAVEDCPSSTPAPPASAAPPANETLELTTFDGETAKVSFTPHAHTVEWPNHETRGGGDGRGNFEWGAEPNGSGLGVVTGTQTNGIVRTWLEDANGGVHCRGMRYTSDGASFAMADADVQWRFVQQYDNGWIVYPTPPPP